MNDDLTDLVRDLKGKRKRFENECNTVVRAAGAMCVAEAQQLVPVDTGATKSSIHAEMRNRTTVDVGPSTPYAPHLEYGTSRTAPRPFMEPAADKAGEWLEEAVADIAEEVL